MEDRFTIIRKCFEKDHFAATSGVVLEELGDGFAKAKLTVEERHLNGVGIVQGGAIFTLSDFAFAVASNTGGRVAVAVSTNLSFFKATTSGTLFAEAREVSRSRKLSACSVRVTDDGGNLVALFQGTAFIKDTLFPPSL